MTITQIDEALRIYESGLPLIKVGKAVRADPKTVKARLIERGVAILNTRM